MLSTGTELGLSVGTCCARQGSLWLSVTGCPLQMSTCNLKGAREQSKLYLSIFNNNKNLCYETFPWQRPTVGSHMKLTAVLLKKFQFRTRYWSRWGKSYWLNTTHCTRRILMAIPLSGNMLHMPRAQQTDHSVNHPWAQMCQLENGLYRCHSKRSQVNESLLYPWPHDN